MVMTKVAVKSGIKQLSWFEGSPFEYYEAFISFKDELNLLLQTQMKLVSVHLPGSVPVGDKHYPLDFNRNAPGFQQSCQILDKVFNFCELHEVRNIVIHVGFFNCYTENRYEVIKGVVDLFKNYRSGNVRLCVENVPRWINISFVNEPLISDEGHINYFKSEFPEGGFVFDVDHAAIDAVYSQFYDEFKPRFEKEGDYFLFRKKIEKEILDTIDKRPDFFEAEINDRIASFLKAASPDIIHILGTDYTKLFYFDKLPLVGEALPLKFDGEIEGYPVKDRIDHEKWIPLISLDKSEKIFVLELMMRPKDYDLVEALNANMNYLSRYLNIN